MNNYSSSIPPFDSAEVMATFLPTSSVNYSSTLTIVNNDVVKSIALSGAAQECPAITTSIDTLSAMVSTCDVEATLESFTIGNTVANPALNYSFIKQYDKTSSIYYTKAQETTRHIFPNIYSNEITLIITLNGDYTDNIDEYATLEIEGTSFGKINTEVIADGENYTRTYSLDAEISGIGEVSLGERLVYPNPATSHIYVNLCAEMENATLEIINLSRAKLQHIEEYTSGN